MLIPIMDVGKVGVVKDIPGHSPGLPFNAWTDARNVRFAETGVLKANGWSRVRATQIEPYGVSNFSTPGNTFLTYMGVKKVYGVVGELEADITRVSGDYTGTVKDFWQSTSFNGIPILNNGVDPPQAWLGPALETPLIDLPDWPEGLAARIVRGFKNFIVAFNVRGAGFNDPRMVKWSHSAEPGYLPTSWDHTDPTKEAGEFSISGSDDYLIDAVQLGQQMVIYGRTSMHRMAYAGQPFIFAIDGISESVGLLALGCCQPILLQHFIVGLDDIVLYDGSSMQSIIESRLRSWFFKNIDPLAHGITRTVVNRKQREVWVFFPEVGSSILTKALVWNWAYDSWSIRDIPNVRSMTFQPFVSSSEGVWGADSQQWDEDHSAWDSEEIKRAFLGTFIMGSVFPMELLALDSGYQAKSANFTSYVERTGMDISRGENGTAVHDPSRVRLITSVWPFIEAPAGTAFTVKVGQQQDPWGQVTWQDSGTWVAGQSPNIDLYATGRYLAVRFEESSNAAWRLYGYQVDVTDLGYF